MSRGGGRYRKKGQATVEMALALVIGFLIAIASFKLWAWLTQAIVEESSCYQETRRQAGHVGFKNPGLGRKPVDGFTSTVPTEPPPYGNPYWYERPRLNIFNDGVTIGPRCR